MDKYQSIFDVLLELESDIVKNKYDKQFRKKQLKFEIKEMKKR